MNKLILRQAEALHKLGFAIHWLRPKSKIPVENGWTSKPKKDWPSLKRAFKKGFNVGVRLGKVSKIGNEYLAVIDCDVKSSDKKHLNELAQRLEKIFPGYADKTILVQSGRGNGSMHVYIKTKTPVATRRLAQSSEQVKVYLPSVKPSKRDLKILNEKEIKEGYRSRAAWEISLMGEGSQVVLPPSIHPDTNKQYWFDDGELPTESDHIYSLELPDANAPKTEDAIDLKDVDLLDGRLPDHIVDMIVHGKGVEDRSKAVFASMNAMLDEGFSDNEILSVFTEDGYALGEVAFDHAKTRSRERAAKWLMRYPLAKAKASKDVSEVFNEEIEPMRSVDGIDIEDEVRSKAEKNAWKKELVKSDNGLVKPLLKNVVMILRGTFGADCIKRNLFASTDTWTVKTPWSEPNEWVTDAHAVSFKLWLSNKFKVEPSVNTINEAFNAIASENAHHPVRAWLKGLEWDGVNRVDTWLEAYLNSKGQPSEYLRAVGRLMLVGMVARVFEPGCKFDWVPILEGTQGVGKSSTPRILAGDDWFSDSFLSVSDKDAVMNLQGVWCYEIGELTAMSKYETGLMKQFVARTSDKIRPPYGSRMVEFPRQCIFVGTTDKEEYLKDDVGQRRYLPVSVGQCEFHHLAKDRAQLFAEAVELYLNGFSLVEEGKACEEMAKPITATRVETDYLAEQLNELLNDGSLRTIKTKQGVELCISDILYLPEVLHLGIKNSRADQMRVANALKNLGFRKVGQISKRHRKMVWRRPRGLD